LSNHVVPRGTKRGFSDSPHGSGRYTKLLKELGAGKATALPAVKLLHKLGLIETYENGKQGTVNPRATIYRRLR
jgi:hypothetical protein